MSETETKLKFNEGLESLRKASREISSDFLKCWAMLSVLGEPLREQYFEISKRISSLEKELWDHADHFRSDSPSSVAERESLTQNLEKSKLELAEFEKLHFF